MKQRAFTLIEILVCIAIIAILAGLLITAGKSAIRASQATVCESNLHQLSIAIEMYRNDMGDFPPSNEQWAGLKPYLSNAVLRCPYADIAQQNDPLRLRVNYYVNGRSFIPTKQELACRETRGAAFPIAYDANHASPFVAIAAARSFYIYARVDGSVAQVDSKMISNFLLNPSPYPCPGASAFYNFP